MNKLFLICALAFILVGTSYSQTIETKETVEEKAADVSITATVKAKSLVFETVPNPTVKFPGTPKRNTEWSSKRENLPDEVKPNVIYRDIGIRLKIVSVFADIDKIVDEALGRTPKETPTLTEDENKNDQSSDRKEKPYEN